MFDSTNLLTDQLESAVIDANSSANITTTQSYNPYGTLSFTTGSWTTPFEFAGGYRDITELIFLIIRFYDPTTGQFMSADPMARVTGRPMGILVAIQ